MQDRANLLSEMNDRSREVFRRVVEGYLTSGDPIGSRTLTRSMTEKLSAATIRNVMQDLEYLGLLDSPHVSAGRIPTHRGLRLFVDGLMELGTVAQDDRAKNSGNAVRQEHLPDGLPLGRAQGKRGFTLGWGNGKQHVA